MRTNCKQKRYYERYEKLLEYSTISLQIKLLVCEVSLSLAYWYIIMAPSSVLRFFKIKFASHNLLFYVVYMCHKIIGFHCCIQLLQEKMNGGIILVGAPCTQACSDQRLQPSVKEALASNRRLIKYDYISLYYTLYLLHFDLISLYPCFVLSVLLLREFVHTIDISLY